jgi:choline-phosphate cytidylyltransferase
MKRVITFGTFDLFHVGHLNILVRAAEFGEYLTVGVSSDELNERKKGFRPLFSLPERMAIVSALRMVDNVFIEETLEEKREYVKRHRAEILVMGDDWHGRFDDLQDICEVVYLPRTQDISTTALKERMRFPV